jgi:hypothetical protein
MCLILIVATQKNYPHPEWIITADAFFDNDFYAPNSYFKNIVIP